MGRGLREAEPPQGATGLAWRFCRPLRGLGGAAWTVPRARAPQARRALGYHLPPAAGGLNGRTARVHAESTEALRPAEGAKGLSADRLCFILLAACVPASMLLVLTPVEHLARQQSALWDFYKGIAPAYPDWLEYFAVQTLAAAVAVCGAWGLLTHRVQRPRAFAMLLGAFALWSAASYFWSVWPYGTRAGVVRDLPFWLLAVAASLVFRSERRWLTLARVFLAAALVQAAVASIAVAHLAHVNHLPFTTAFYQDPVFYQNKNYSCAILLTAIYIAVGLAVRRARAGGWWPAAAGGLAAVALLGFLFAVAGALAGWVALAVSAPAYALCLLPVKRKGLIVAAAAGLAVLVLLGALSVGSVRQGAVKWATDPRGTANLRVSDWSAGLSAFAARPVAGWGVSTWPCVFPRFAPPMASRMPQTATTRPEHPHNEFVRVAANLGIVGLLLYAGLLAVVFGASFRALMKRPLETRLVGCALWAGALAFLVQTLFGNETMGWCFSANYWLLLGVLASAAWWREGEGPSARMTAGGLVVLALAAAVVAWGWWSWGVGSYRSMVNHRMAEEANQWLGAHPEQPAAKLATLQDALELARPRSLQPATMLYYDYVVGGTMARLGQWEQAARYLEDNVERWAPGMLQSDLWLAVCYANTGQLGPARDHALRYVAENPYKLDGYTRLADLDPAQAASLLEGELYEREGVGDPDKVMTLLQFYAELGAWDRARALVQEAARANHVEPATIVQALAELLVQGGRPEALPALRAAFPGMLPGGGAQPSPQQVR